MTFKNQKEEVIEIELTSYGKHLLSKGKFRPTFYAFFDDDILYDAEYGGEAEEQNYAQTRILEETPRLRVQSTYTGLETEIEKQIEEARNKNKKIKDAFQTTRERHYALSAPLGKSTLQSDYSPSWDITLHGSEFEQQLIVLNEAGNDKDGPTGRILPIPQMNLKSLDYLTRVVKAEAYAEVHAPEDDTSPVAREEFFENGNIVEIRHGDIVIEIDELHTDSLTENYDIEFFSQETDSNGLEVLVPLYFITGDNNKIVDGLYVGGERESPEEIREDHVEKYLSVSIDREIDASTLCRLGYRTDFSKRGHIKVTCKDVVGESRMDEIYEEAGSLPPFGDDC